MAIGEIDAALRRLLDTSLLSEEVLERFRRLMREAIRSELTDALDGELLDVAGAAKLLTMTEGAVRKAAERGQLPCQRIDRRLRFRRSELLGLGTDGRTHQD